MGTTEKLLGVAIVFALTTTCTCIRSQYSSLGARLKVDDDVHVGESPNCWESLFQLQACTGEVVMFFLNGETYLGPSCCQAIRVVGHDCWPDMLASLGFTTQEGDILQGYCDTKEQHSPPSPPSPTAVAVDNATKVLP
ncbi:egg cell-secreted protein 1.1 [Gastrolobium bilobum]|uniref:egg cell-secreted protein 1.1 n=1 Tax=Gastrolobium bilobum TaxID=150636 RepID=UPI002AB05983|nr:egg cell-secreted protein 1.1 [Gastrolobium bilobum]